tara:strand:+ start:1417 stop:2490 length:1074 start_codon:yes stop_codon:yes gene_type:complete
MMVEKVLEPEHARELHKHILNRAYRKYSLLTVVWVLGALTHAGFVGFFYKYGTPELGGYNILSVLMWLSAGWLTRQGKLSAAIWIIFFEIIVFAALSAHYVGLDAGFHNYIWCLAALMVISPSIHALAGVALAFLSMGIYGLLYVFFDARVSTNIPDSLWTPLHVCNAVIAAVPVIFSIGTVRRTFENQHMKFERLANYDSLTGLPNRRLGARALQDRRLDPDSSSNIVALADVDYFKTINDRYGHEIGDAVLLAIANFLKSALREQDLACRWGGEEFLILLSNTRMDSAAAILERIRKDLSEAQLIPEFPELRVTMSFGLASRGSQESDQTISEWLARADAKLYQAKRDGRNRVLS